MGEFAFKPALNAEPALWLEQRLTTFGENVLSIVPSGFEAYARVFHPAEKVTNTSDDWAVWPREPLLWSEVAALTGMQAHRAMQWPSLRGDRPSVQEYPPAAYSESWVETPTEGTLPLALAQILWPTLEPHTKTHDTCFFAIWEGFGSLPRTVLDAPAFELPARKYHLFAGPLEAIEKTFSTNDLDEAVSMGVFVAYDLEEENVEEAEGKLEQLLASQEPSYQSANLWWPADRAWCVATEIDFNTTYIVGSQALVTALLEHPALETYRVDPTDGVSYAGDTVNPVPADPYGGSFKL